jgi:hypothetical protein
MKFVTSLGIKKIESWARGPEILKLIFAIFRESID